MIGSVAYKYYKAYANDEISKAKWELKSNFMQNPHNFDVTYGKNGKEIVDYDECII